MRPETMEKALEFVQDEPNTLYLQNRNEGGSSKKDWQQPSSSSNFKLPLNNFTPKMTPFNTQFKPPNFNMPGPSRPFTMQSPPRPGWQPNQFNNQLQQPRGLTRTQQMMRAPIPNYNPQSNVFRLPNRPQQQPSFQPGNSAPQPMSGVSHFVPKPLPPSGHDWRKFGNPSPSNYFKTRDANFYEYNDSCDYFNYDDNYYTDDQYYYQQYPEDYYNYVQYEKPTEIQELEQSPANNEQNFQVESKSEKPI